MGSGSCSTPRTTSRSSAKPTPPSVRSLGSPRPRPDVAILDVRLPDGDGIAVCREIRSDHGEVACLMLTSFSDDEALVQAVVAGASGYLLKQIRGTDIVDAVRQGVAG